MIGIPRELAEHHLRIPDNETPVFQKKRLMASERNTIVNKEAVELVAAGVLRETTFPSWISNSIMVKKVDGSHCICVDFTNLNKACPKDCYHLPEIEQKVESLKGFRWKSFPDAYKV